MIRTIASTLLGAFPWPLCPMRALWKGCDSLKPWKFLRARAAVRSAAGARRRARSDRTLVFVSDAPRMREAKLAKGLRAAGWDVTLLYGRRPGFDLDYYFTRAEGYRDPWDALDRASRLSPVAFHVFVALQYHLASEFVRHRPGPVVIDSSDVLQGMKSSWYHRKYLPGQAALERFCLEQADGICSRDLQVQYLKRVLGYRFKGKVLFFPDLTIPETEARRPAIKDGRGEIHVALIGIIGLERFQPYWKDAHVLKIAQALARDRVHFHLYGTAPMQWQGYEYTYADYLALARETPYFHLHRPVPLTQLLEELRSYDFGIHVAGPRLHFDYGRHSGHTRASYDCTVTNRHFDYLQAQLPIILHNGRLASWVVSRLGVALHPDAGFLEAPREWLAQRRPDEAQREKLARAPEAIALMRHIPRLERFYRSLADRPFSD